MKEKQFRLLQTLKSRLSIQLDARFKHLYLFGSVAKGTDNEDSDIDILVLCDFGGRAGLQDKFGVYDITGQLEVENLVVFHDIVEDVRNADKHDIREIIREAVEI